MYTYMTPDKLAGALLGHLLHDALRQHVLYTCISTHAHIQVNPHAYIYMFIHIRIYIYIHTLIYICIAADIYIYIYIYIFSHTYITTGKLADALRVDELHDKVQQHESYIYTTTYAHTHNNPHA